jgi:hypothetical protein
VGGLGGRYCRSFLVFRKIENRDEGNGRVLRYIAVIVVVVYFSAGVVLGREGEVGK